MYRLRERQKGEREREREKGGEETRKEKLKCFRSWGELPLNSALLT